MDASQRPPEPLGQVLDHVQQLLTPQLQPRRLFHHNGREPHRAARLVEALPRQWQVVVLPKQLWEGKGGRS